MRELHICGKERVGGSHTEGSRQREREAETKAVPATNAWCAEGKMRRLTNASVAYRGRVDDGAGDVNSGR